MTYPNCRLTYDILFSNLLDSCLINFDMFGSVSLFFMTLFILSQGHWVLCDSQIVCTWHRGSLFLISSYLSFCRSYFITSFEKTYTYMYIYLNIWVLRVFQGQSYLCFFWFGSCIVGLKTFGVIFPFWNFRLFPFFFYSVSITNFWRRIHSSFWYVRSSVVL